MSSAITLERLLDSRRLWRGQGAFVSAHTHLPTGHAALDAVLPGGGWPRDALSEILTAYTGVGELRLLWPALAQLTAVGKRVVLVSPPYVPYPQAWLHAGVDLMHLSIVQAAERDVIWAAEQCLRSGSCGAVVCWIQRADDRALRRLQVAAGVGKAVGWAYRPLRDAANPSPAALRLSLQAKPAQIRVLKCRGGLAPDQPIAADLY